MAINQDMVLKALIVILVVVVVVVVNLPQMERASNFLISIQWPVVALIAVIMFRGDVRSLFNRITKLSKDGAEFEQPQRLPKNFDPAAPRPVAGPTSGASGNPPSAPTQKLSLQETVAPVYRAVFNENLARLRDRLPAVRTMFSEPDTEIALALAAELAASVQLERASRSIFQSQLDALDELKWRTVKKQEFRRFFERGEILSPKTYERYSFDQWFNFLVVLGLSEVRMTKSK